MSSNPYFTKIPKETRKITVQEIREFFDVNENVREFCNQYASKGKPYASRWDTLLAFIIMGVGAADRNYRSYRWDTESSRNSSWRQNWQSPFNLYKQGGSYTIKQEGIQSGDTLEDVFRMMCENPTSIIKMEGSSVAPQLSRDARKDLEKMLGMQNSSGNSAAGEEKTMSMESKLKALIDNRQYQIILTGAPGTGKTYLAKKIARQYIAQEYGMQSENDLSDEEMQKLNAVCKDRIKMVQFHPSYDYTDFVEGLRPVVINNQMVFQKMDGTFKAFCRFVAGENRKESDVAAQESKKRYFFLIDEINRADLSKVFGELMFCLEGDKRGERVDTQYQGLPVYDKDGKEIREEDDVFHKGFFIPRNIVIIGTMNDIDRSVESMDFALRRRFVWEEVKVEKDLLENTFGSSRFFGGKLEDKAIHALADIVVTFNDNMKKRVKYLNSGYDISQGQFANMPDEYKTDIDTILKWVWEYRVESLLKEYMRGDQECDRNLEELRGAWSYHVRNESADSEAHDDSGEQL